MGMMTTTQRYACCNFDQVVKRCLCEKIICNFSLKSSEKIDVMSLWLFLCHIQNTGPSSFADELAARIKGEPVNKPEGDRACKSLSLSTNCQ